MPNKRLKLAARVDYGMSLSSAPQLKRGPLGGMHMRTPFLPAVIVFSMALACAPQARAQRIMYDAATHDSMAIFGFDAMELANGDSSLVFLYRTFLPLGDTARVRKEALGWWPVISANVKVRGFRRAGVVVLWAKDPSDSLFDLGPAAQYAIPFVRDSSACWHLLGDTTQISTCSPLSR